MIDRAHALSLVTRARQLGISRGSIYYLPRGRVPDRSDDHAMHRRTASGLRVLPGLLRQEGTAGSASIPPEVDRYQAAGL